MYDIHMATVSQEFVACWSAARQHIHAAGDNSVGWIRAHLTPPILEHLSFRLGNQLFFVRVEDVDEAVDAPGILQGLLFAADICNAHACLMPMRKQPEGWVPSLPGWGLLDARTGDIVTPPALISEENIEMTEWELQDLAIQVVRNQIEGEGYELMSWQSNPEIHPSLWFVGDSGPEWVIVRTAKYPATKANLPEDLAAIAENCHRQGDKGHFASVVFTKDGPLYRGHSINVEYEKPTPIDLEREGGEPNRGGMPM
jgi:hypothetical protein